MEISEANLGDFVSLWVRVGVADVGSVAWPTAAQRNFMSLTSLLGMGHHYCSFSVPSYYFATQRCHLVQSLVVPICCVRDFCGAGCGRVSFGACGGQRDRLVEVGSGVVERGAEKVKFWKNSSLKDLVWDGVETVVARGVLISKRGSLVVRRVWADGGNGRGGRGAKKGFCSRDEDYDRRVLASEVTGDITREKSAVNRTECEDYIGGSPDNLEKAHPGSDYVRVTVKQNFHSSRSNHEVSRNTETRFYFNKHIHRFGSRTYASSRQKEASVALQHAIANDRHMNQRDFKMQNGKFAKRPAPSSEQQDADERKPKKKRDPAETELRRSIDMCSKYADVMRAIQEYDKVVAEGKIVFNQYNYNVLLYLCSSGATGSLKRAKSGSEKLKSSAQGEQTVCANGEPNGTVVTDSKVGVASDTSEMVVLTEDQKLTCLERGFEIYEAMKLQGVPPNEATFTAVARLAVAKEDGDLAFDMVKQMAKAKLAPRLRSYGPALHTFCKLKNVDKAFEVDEHMRAAGVRPEEGELEALLKMCADAGLEDRVYSLLHCLRTTVRELSPSIAGVIKQWFESRAAASAGRSRWDSLPSQEAVKDAIESHGGGWHGLGWLGCGVWKVKRSVLDETGVCRECGEQLVTIDIDPKETEVFAESLSALACQREGKNNEFKKFQAWLDRHGPFDAIVDGANVGLFNQNFGEGGFNFHQLNSVVNGIREQLGSEREPLILLHHRRTRGGPAASAFATKALSRWHEAHAIYTTPTGSNDDWYWLYAAVRYKCLLVTNDEMRDHLFQLLGNEFFPKWKDRHQVRFSLSKEGPIFHMPPPYSILIQESANGFWHIPTTGGDDIVSPREWLCVTRTGDAMPELVVGLEEKLPTEPKSLAPECKPLEVAHSELKELSISVEDMQDVEFGNPSLKTTGLPSMESLSPRSVTTLQELDGENVSSSQAVS